MSEASLNDIMKLPDIGNSLWYKNFGLNSYKNRVTVNTEVKGPQRVLVKGILHNYYITWLDDSERSSKTDQRYIFVPVEIP